MLCSVPSHVLWFALGQHCEPQISAPSLCQLWARRELSMNCAPYLLSLWSQHHSYSSSAQYQGNQCKRQTPYCWGPRSLMRNTGTRYMLCSYSFLLSNQCSSGEDARIDTLQNCSIRSPWVSTVLDCEAGSLYGVSISDSALLQFLQKSKQDCERLAALHCALLCFQHTEDLEMQVGKEPLLNFFPVIDVLHKAGAGHEWCKPKRSPNSPGSAKRLISWAALISFISPRCPENICVSITIPHEVLLPKPNFLYSLKHLLK